MNRSSRTASRSKGKRSYWFLILEVIFVVSLLSNMVVYGGIPSLPKVGSILENALSKQRPILTMYMRGGEWLLQVPGLQSASHRVLNSALGKGFDEIVRDPSNAALAVTDRSFNATHSTLHLLRWSTPILFIAALIGQFFRPRQLHSLGAR